MDVTRPELCPSPFKIYQATDMQGLEDGDFHHGFILAMRTDVRDLVGGSHFVRDRRGDNSIKRVQGFKFKAWVAGDKEIRVSAPQLSWSDRGNDDLDIVDQYGQHGMICTALNVARNGYIQRAGIESYENKEKIYVLRLMESDDINIKLDGAVLECNKASKRYQQQPGLLSPFVVNLSIDVSTTEDTLEEIELTLGKDKKKKVSVWKVAQVPRLMWRVANVAQQSRRIGLMQEDVDEEEEDDDIMAQMSKKVAGMRIGKPKI